MIEKRGGEDKAFPARERKKKKEESRKDREAEGRKGVGE